MKAWLSKQRYALPGRIERAFAGPDAVAALGLAARKRARHGQCAALGYFPRADEDPERIVSALLDAATGLNAGDYLAVKAPQLGFDPDRFLRLARSGATLVFDAHAPDQAQPTLDAVEGLLPHYPGTGAALPARWRRSSADAERLRDTSAVLRLVKGEWVDPGFDGDCMAAFLGLTDQLAGRSTRVAVASHDPLLVRAALTRLIDAGTPCELEQLRGLPSRRTAAIARDLGVPVRFYLPFGPGWWPYALDKALTRPYLPQWWIADLFGQGL